MTSENDNKTGEGGPGGDGGGEDHDARTTRCRRLGHEVPFGYCRTERDGQPCRLVLDCWWQHFDVQSVLKAGLTPENYAELQQRPPNKLSSIFEIMEEAKKRAAEKKAKGGKGE